MKEQKYYCDGCKKEIWEGIGLTIVVQATEFVGSREFDQEAWEKGSFRKKDMKIFDLCDECVGEEFKRHSPAPYRSLTFKNRMRSFFKKRFNIKMQPKEIKDF